MTLVSVDVVAAISVDEQGFDYQLISDLSDREWAESAAGFITFGLGQAVVKVLEAGNLLAEAKQRLPHGQYLPWVQQACGLKESHARKLVQAAEWVNREHVPGLDQITDTATLFLLSADATPEDVREWFMERCAAGDVPSRREVQERKRSAGQPRQLQDAEALALTILRKGEVDRLREALALAERAQVVVADQVMAEQRLRDLGKQRFIAGADADFHRMKDGSWIRLPHAGRVDIALTVESSNDQGEPIHGAVAGPAEQRVSIKTAAQILNCSENTINQRLSPKKIAEKGPWRRNSYVVKKGGRGIVVISSES